MLKGVYKPNSISYCTRLIVSERKTVRCAHLSPIYIYARQNSEQI